MLTAVLNTKKAVTMSETKIAEIAKQQAVLEAHFQNHGNQLESLLGSTKELHKSVTDQQKTIIEQSIAINNAVDKMASAIDNMEETQKEARENRTYTEAVDKRVLRIEEKMKYSEAVWGPVKTNAIRAVVLFFCAGIIWAAVKAFNNGV